MIIIIIQNFVNNNIPGIETGATQNTTYYKVMHIKITMFIGHDVHSLFMLDINDFLQELFIRYDANWKKPFRQDETRNCRNDVYERTSL